MKVYCLYSKINSATTAALSKQNRNLHDFNISDVYVVRSGKSRAPIA